MRLGGEARFEDGLEQQQEELLDDAVLERGRRVGEAGLELAAGNGDGGGRVGGGADEKVGGGAPGEGGVAAERGGAEAEEAVERGERDGLARGEGARGVGAGALIGEEPEVEAGGVAGEVGERGRLRMRESAAPQRGEEVDGVVDEEGIRVRQGAVVYPRRRRRGTRGAASDGIGEEAAQRLARRRHCGEGRFVEVLGRTGSGCGRSHGVWDNVPAARLHTGVLFCSHDHCEPFIVNWRKIQKSTDT